MRRALAFVLFFTLISACPQAARTIATGAAAAVAAEREPAGFLARGAPGAPPNTGTAGAPGADHAPATGPVEDLAARIAPRDAPELERARAVYGWIAEHVRYDVDGYLAGAAMAKATPEEVLERRLAVCSGYAVLFQALALAAGLESIVIDGWAKGIDEWRSRRPNHAWVAVLVGGRWVLADPTWGAGYVANGEFVRRYTDDWFDVDPIRMRFTHHPKDGRWQLAQRRISRRAFAALPAARPEIFRLGIDPAALERAARDHRITALPDAFPVAGRAVELRDVPLSGWLDSGRSYRFALIAWGGAEAFISNGGRRFPLRPGDLPHEFVGDLQVAAGQATLFVRFDAEPDTLYPVVSYHAY